MSIFYHNISMGKEKKLTVFLIVFYFISFASIFSFSKYIVSDNSLVIKQTIFYAVGIGLIFLLKKISFKRIINFSFYIYLINVLLLILVLFVGDEINGTRAWINLGFLGVFQPSEFMKIGIILYGSCIIREYDEKKFGKKCDLILLLKLFVMLLIPSILTFLEPDTGAIFIYFISVLFMLFISDIKKTWFILLFIILFFTLGSVLYLYNFHDDILIKIFGSSLFYRLDRLFDWSNSSGMQLSNSLIAIGASGFFGNGLNNILIYFPEGHTDFIFTSLTSIFGLVGSLILIVLFIFFDFFILDLSNKKNKYVVMGFIGILLYQQIQNISMTIGLLPITGITLPFISYGGSSLISYMILLGLVI